MFKFLPPLFLLFTIKWAQIILLRFNNTFHAVTETRNCVPRASHVFLLEQRISIHYPSRTVPQFSISHKMRLSATTTKTRRERKGENLNTEIFALKVPIYCGTRLMLCLCRQVVRSD